MEVDFSIALMGAIAGLIGAAIAHFTTLRTTDRTTEKEVSLKQLETDNAIELSTLKQGHEISFAQQTFVREIIQSTLERTPSPEDQIRNLRAYARIGLIGDPYAERILALENEELPQVGSFERILSDPSVDLPVSYFRRLLEVSRAVGMVRIASPAVRSTGFLVGDGLVMTAGHLLRDEAAAEKAVIVMDREGDPSEADARAQEFRLEPERLCIVDKGLDFALVAAAPVSDQGVEITRYGRLDGATVRSAIDDRVNLIHHPLGGPKRIAMREGRVVSADETRLFYRAASAPGSGGAPVLDDRFEVVAMHLGKVQRRPELVQAAPRDERTADGPAARMTPGLAWESCQGVQWRAISDHLRSLSRDLSVGEIELLQSIWR